MLQAHNVDYAYLHDQVKFYIAFGTACWSLFKGWNWIQSIKTNDLKHIQDGVGGLQKDISQQTTILNDALKDQTRELQELRQDIRSFYAPVAQTAMVARARRKRTPRKRKKK